MKLFSTPAEAAASNLDWHVTTPDGVFSTNDYDEAAKCMEEKSKLSPDVELIELANLKYLIS